MCVFVCVCGVCVCVCVIQVLLFGFLWFELLVVIVNVIVIFCLFCLNMSVAEILIVHSAPSSVFLLEVCALQIVIVAVGGFSPGKFSPSSEKSQLPQNFAT